jgi:hypothetical protein
MGDAVQRSGGEGCEELVELEKACAEFRLDLRRAIAEKARELRLRRHFRAVPNGRLKPAQLRDFLSRSFGAGFDEELVKSVTLSGRGPRLDEEKLACLDSTQNGRCALCGRILVKDVRPHVDHKVPVVLGGKSILSNYQLLCEKCNLGKGASLDWLMASPFFDDCRDNISTRMRYCVLASAEGRCSEESCDETSFSEELKVVPVVAVQHGGRYIFDNLRVLCVPHARERERRLRNAVTGLMKRGGAQLLALRRTN